MLDFINNLSGKKIALILIILVILLGSFMMFAFITVRDSARNSVPTDPGKALRDQRNNPSDSPDITITPGPVVTTNDFLNDYYAISYPSNWIVEPVVLPNGDRNIIFKPSHSKNGEDMFLLISTDNRSTSIDQRAENFVKQGYIKSEVYHNGTKYLKVNNISGQSNTVSQQISYLYVVTQGTTITVQYVYTGAKQDAIIENFFNQVLSTLTIF